MKINIEKEKGYVKGLGYVRGNGGDYHCYKVIINGNKFTINYNSNKYHHSGTYQVIDKHTVKYISGHIYDEKIIQKYYNAQPNRMYNIDIIPKYKRVKKSVNEFKNPFSKTNNKKGYDKNTIPEDIAHLF